MDVRQRTGPPALDAEKTGRELLLSCYRRPAGVEISLTRSTLLFGTRGAGKTMLLRRCRHLAGESAYYGDLRKILNPVSSDTGAAGLSFEVISPSLEPKIRRKTAAVLALWLANQVVKRGRDVPWIELMRCLPHDYRRNEPRDRESALYEIELSIWSANLGSFSESPPPTSLNEFLAEMATYISQETGQVLTLLLDRAEEVPYPSLSVVLGLLDQSQPFLSMVAARPGVLGPYHSLGHDQAVPGDHYSIQHLGTSPYEEDWARFQSEVLAAWIPSAVERIPSSELALMQRLSRDSVRILLELVYNSIDENGEYSRNLFVKKFGLLRANLESAAQGRLRGLNDDLGRLVRRVRKKIAPVTLPVLLQVPHGEQSQLPSLREMSRDERFIRLALRSGYLSVPHGVTWHPHKVVTEVELHPIFIWNEGDRWS